MDTPQPSQPPEVPRQPKEVAEVADALTMLGDKVQALHEAAPCEKHQRAVLFIKRAAYLLTN